MSSNARSNRRKERARRQLADKGWAMLASGLAFLVLAPALLKGPVIGALAPALRPAGWIAVLLGIVLLGLHYATGRRATAPTPDQPLRNGRVARTASGAPRQPAWATPTPPHGAADSATPQRQSHWSRAVLDAIEWRRFEALCEAFYAQAGLATRSQSHGADGGVDIWLQSKHMDAPRVVQCKHWRSRPVGVKEMREFLGVMAAHQLRHGTYVTSSTFTADAIAFAKANGIALQDGAALLKLIGQRTPEEQAALLAVAQEGDYWRPTCASCGTKMVERTSSKRSGAFWGCANFPRCRGKVIAKADAWDRSHAVPRGYRCANPSTLPF